MGDPLAIILCHLCAALVMDFNILSAYHFNIFVENFYSTKISDNTKK